MDTEEIHSESKSSKNSDYRKRSIIIRNNFSKVQYWRLIFEQNKKSNRENWGSKSKTTIEKYVKII